MTDVTSALARAAWGSLETLHVVGFFAPEVQEAYDQFPVRTPRAGYFAARSSPLGEASPQLVTATFYVFSPALVARSVPDVWRVAAPQQWADARAGGVSAALHRVLGSPDVAEAVVLAGPDGDPGPGRGRAPALRGVEHGRLAGGPADAVVARRPAGPGAPRRRPT